MPNSHAKRYKSSIKPTLSGVFQKLIGKRTPLPAVRDQIRQRLHFDAADFSVIYAIGDIHGCYSKLLEAKRKIFEDFSRCTGTALIVMLGDYVDRGPSSMDVIEHLCKSTPANIKQVTLCGNHDDAFLRLLEEPDLFPSWYRFAGSETLKSYGIDVAYLLKHGSNGAIERAINDAVPDHHRKLLAEMPSMVTVGDIVFVHAGIRPGIALSEQRNRDLFWIREPFLSRGPELPLLVVHGHTPVAQPFFGNGRIAIDTGAFATGRLTVLRIMNRQAVVLR
ncbi:metallophosphoesterase family protein [Rhizobium mesosinicum]|uniref:Serine/threonine protein phosphatase n=1 Tax=Rhizobium mesosinicum TaxID=335017 RepID=A0ABS7H152_9HYPH|nr:metallophosphoesterase family protein [Rhizobium mesosinicum]MBW9055954.1 serine/threonine protein phosphatase [Rhizobium mesosinicum]